MARSRKKTYIDSTSRKADIRKQMNRAERRAIKYNLNEGKYEGLAQSKKFLDSGAEWDD